MSTQKVTCEYVNLKKINLRQAKSSPHLNCGARKLFVDHGNQSCDSIGLDASGVVCAREIGARLAVPSRLLMSKRNFIINENKPQTERLNIPNTRLQS